MRQNVFAVFMDHFVAAKFFHEYYYQVCLRYVGCLAESHEIFLGVKEKMLL